MSNDDMVLVWRKNRGRDGKAIIHAHADCSTIVNRNPPRRSILYGVGAQLDGCPTARRDFSETTEQLTNADRACDTERALRAGQLPSRPSWA
jgi:hypothetical protein